MKRASVNLNKKDSITVEIVQQMSRSRSIAFKKQSRTDMDTFRQELTIDDHVIPLEQVLGRYATSLDTGLEQSWAEMILRRNGPNALMPPKQKARCLVFLEYMFGGFSILLWVGVILCTVGFTVSYTRDPDTPYDQLYLAAVILNVIIITGLFGFYQDSANNRIMDSFSKMVPKSATVLRDGRVYSIPSEKLVVGDIVLIQAGDCVPADVRIFESAGLKVDNSSITGETEPQLRSPECSDLNPLETTNLAFYGTNAIEGVGRGLVIATGDNTLMGHIAGLTTGLQPEPTAIKKELDSFMKIITIISLITGAAIFCMAMMLGYDFFQSFVYFIAIVVANIPEGLLVTMTASLTLTAKKMHKKNCLVKNLHAIETLGSTTVICSDKTGTLTQNRMTVSHIFCDGYIVDVLSPNYVQTKTETFKDLQRVAILCSRAEFAEDEEDVPIRDKKVKGDASESAVLKCMEWMTNNTAGIREDHPKVFEIPFNSTNKYQLSIHTQPYEEALLMVLKGAPERILARCTTMGSNEEDVPLDEDERKKVLSALLELGYMGERVLGFADFILPDKYDENFKFDAETKNFPMTTFRFMGFLSMIDPPRPGVLDAVAKCKTAGIRVIMVTGDHPITAMAIAKKVGIISENNTTVYDIAMRQNISASKVTQEEAANCAAIVVTGGELREMDQEDIDDLVENYDEMVFARTSPQQKLQIVEAFQRAYELVAVTGDGVNDSPALKKADIGIAMGISGSDVSKEAADMIILDDNFASIVVGIEEGRLIFDNLKKSIAYMLTSNVPEVVPFVMHVVFGFPLALNIMAVLIIDVGTDMWPGISLAYEAAESDIMALPPRNPRFERLVGTKLLLFVNLNVGLLQTFAAFSCYFYAMAEHGFLPDRIFNIRDEWYSFVNDVTDSYGQEWAFEDRSKLDRKCVTTFFLAIVCTQIADAIICKTRRLSIVQQGMTNQMMNAGLLFEVFIAMLVVYTPGLNHMLQFEPIRLYLLLPVIPFVVWLILFDEVRRYLLRKNPTGWVARETYF